MSGLAVIGGPLRALARCRDRAWRMTAIAMGVAWLTAASVGAPTGDASPLAGPAGAPTSAPAAAPPTGAPAAAPPTIAGCQVFPADNVWNTRIDTLPVHARSDAWISSIGSDTGLKADFGSGLWQGAPIGIPYTTAPGSQPPVDISFYYDGDSDHGAYRIPPNAPIEGGSDDHVLVVDRDRCILTEVFDATKLSDTAWEAGSGAFFNLGSNALRTDGWTSADAAGLPILPGLARYDEVLAGEIAHALRFTAQRTQGAYIWPARHEASSITDPNVPPMGARVRLKSSVNVSAYSAQVRVILTALQRYGMFLADNGSNWYMSGAPDERWNNDTLRRFSEIKGNMLEFVDESSLMVHPDSGQVRTAGPPPPPPPPPPPLPPPPPPPPPPVSCSPRPAARVDVARTVPGRLDVTIMPGVGPAAPTNRPRAVRFGAPSNARILVNGQPIGAGTRVVLPAGSTQARFSVERITTSQGATVPLVLEDDCGDWSTFVGGGPAAW